jgi:hypothetical protein
MNEVFFPNIKLNPSVMQRLSQQLPFDCAKRFVGWIDDTTAFVSLDSLRIRVRSNLIWACNRDLANNALEELPALDILSNIDIVYVQSGFVLHLQ